MIENEFVIEMKQTRKNKRIFKIKQTSDCVSYPSGNTCLLVTFYWIHSDRANNFVVIGKSNTQKIQTGLSTEHNIQMHHTQT